MAAQQQTPQSARIPPDVPSDPGISQALGVYLRNFSLWARNGFAEQMRNNVALQGVQLRGYDTPAGENPAIWMLEASGSGTLALAPVALGTGKVGDPVPVGSDVPSDTISIKSVSNEYAYLGFYDSTPTRRGYVGWNNDLPGTTLTNDISGGQITFNDNGYTYFTGEVVFNNNINTNGGISTSPDSMTHIQNPGGWIGQAESTNFMVQSAGPGNSAMMTFHCAGEFACQFGLHGDGHLHVGGWSFGAGVWYQVWTQADFAHPRETFERLEAKIATLEERLAQLEARL